MSRHLARDDLACSVFRRRQDAIAPALQVWELTPGEKAERAKRNHGQ
jgi:hypothetical protein